MISRGFYAIFLFLVLFPRPLSARGVNEARRLLDEGLVKEAILELEEVQEKDSTNIEVIRLLGYAHREIGELEEAIDCYTKIIGLRRHDYDARLALARLYGRVGSYDQAEMYYLGIWEEDSTDVEALWGLSDVYLWTDRLVEAERYASRAALLRPELATSHFKLAKIHIARGDLSSARVDYLRITGIDSTYAEIWAGLGQIDDWENRPYRALRQYRKALRLDPENTDYQERLDDLLQRNRIQVTASTGYVREIEDIVDYDSRTAGVFARKRLNDTWEIAFRNRNHFLRRDFVSEPDDSLVRYDHTSVGVTFHRPTFRISSLVGYSFADEEVKNASLQGVWRAASSMRVSLAAGYDFFYAWEDLFSKYVDFGIDYRLSGRWRLSGDVDLTRIKDDPVYDEQGGLVRRDNVRILMNLGTDFLLYRPWLIKLHFIYNLNDHRYISPLHYTPQDLDTYSGGFSFYRETKSLYVYGREIFGTNTDDVDQNVLSLECGFLFEKWAIGLTFFHFYNKYYENATLGLNFRTRV